MAMYIKEDKKDLVALTAYNMDKEDVKGIFVEFNESVYRKLVDDTKHLTAEHSNDSKWLHTEWTQKYGEQNPNVSDCAKTVTHYRGGRREE